MKINSPKLVSNRLSLVAFAISMTLALLSVVVQGAPAKAASLISWSSPGSIGLSSGSTVVALKFGNQVFMAIASNGETFTSPDGVTWTKGGTITGDRLPGYDYLADLAFGLAGAGTTNVGKPTWIYTGRFGGNVWTSFDNGLTWAHSLNLEPLAINGDPNRSTFELKKAAYGDGHFLVGFAGGRFMTSTDGITWNAAGAGSVGNANGEGRMVFGNHTFITPIAFDNHVCTKSTLNWSDSSGFDCSSTLNVNGVTGFVKFWQQIAFGNGLFVGPFDVDEGSNPNNYWLSSDNGKTWTRPSPFTVHPTGITFGGGYFVVDKKDGTTAYSTDGISWTEAGSRPGGGSGMLAFGNGRFIGLGGSGNAVVSTAQFPGPYALAFDSDGGSAVESQEFFQGGPVMDPVAPSKYGYTFAGWSASQVGTAVTFPYFPDGSAAVALHALWTPLPHYVVTFNSGDGSSVAAGEFVSSGTVSRPVEPTRSGYTFGGWSATDGGVSAVSFPYSPGGSSAVTLYALWTPVPRYVVTFDSKSGSLVESTEFVSSGTVSRPVEPTRSGYTFAGWSATDGGSVVSFPYSPGVSEALTLYALWTQNAVVTATPEPTPSPTPTPTVTPTPTPTPAPSTAAAIGLRVLTGAELARATTLVASAPASTNVGQAPVVATSVGIAVAPVVSGLPVNSPIQVSIAFTPAVSLSGASFQTAAVRDAVTATLKPIFIKIGSVKASVSGKVKVPAFKASKAGTYTIKLTTKVGKAFYLKVKVTAKKPKK